MIEYQEGIFGLHTDELSCLLRVNDYGLLELLHFAEPVKTQDAEAFFCRPGLGWGGSVLLEDPNMESCPDVMSLAWSGPGRGDYRESPLALAGVSADFRYDSHEILPGTVPMSTSLPQATQGGQTLAIKLTQPGAELMLYFTLFETAITRRTVLKNTSDTPLKVTRLMSNPS